MSAPGRRAAPWLVCGASLALIWTAYVVRLGHLGPAGSQDGVWATTVTSLCYVAVAVIGAVITARVPGDRYGRLWSGLGLALGMADLGTALERTMPVPPWPAHLVKGVGFFATLAAFALVFLLFPDGRPPSPPWRWLTRATVTLALTGLVGLPLGRIDGDAAWPWPLPEPAATRVGSVIGGVVYLLFGCFVLAVVSTLVRLRRAGDVQRRQAKWFTAAATANGLAIVADLVSLDEVGPFGGDSAFWTVVNGVAFVLLPTSVLVAITRYRLYEIDRIVSRTVSYAVLTAGLLALYVVVVTVLGRLLQPVTGSSELAVAASTLAVAAAFRPARRRVQTVVDRRFDRARYDAARTVEAYARRLRTEVDLAEVTAGLRDTVTATVGPRKLGLWLRDDPAVPEPGA